MKRDTFYFSHDSNSMDDPKIVSLIDSLGMEGYGIFWALLEVLRNQTSFTYPVTSALLKYRAWNTSQDKIKVVISNYDLFSITDNGLFYSNSFLSRMELVDKKRQKYIDSGRKGGLAKALNQSITSDATKDPSDVVSKPSKESKVKESKVNKKEYATSVHLYEKEYETLLEKLGEDGLTWCIAKLDNYKISRGKKYKSDYRAVLSWVIDEYNKRKGSGNLSIGQAGNAKNIGNGYEFK